MTTAPNDQPAAGWSPALARVFARLLQPISTGPTIWFYGHCARQAGGIPAWLARRIGESVSADVVGWRIGPGGQIQHVARRTRVRTVDADALHPRCDRCTRFVKCDRADHAPDGSRAGDRAP
jgi:hypothetical protein